jgi:stalled ribosome alternative rescue factor ArfA
MKTLAFTIQLPRRRRRAVELYSRDTPFRPRVEKSKTSYRRQAKHPHRSGDTE